MSSFLDDESSIEDSVPLEGFEIVTPSTTWRLASGARDVVIGGQRFVASTVARGELTLNTAGDAKELTFTLPVSHALPQRYLANSTPPKQIAVTVWRKQRVSGEAERAWRGLVTSMAVAGHVATFRVPSRMGETLLRRLPTVTAGRACPHILYDAQCRVSRTSHPTSHQQAAQVTVVNGRTITVNTLGGHLDQWARYGEVEHLSSGERMTVMDQTGLVITMQAGIFELATDDVVIIYGGCDHTIGTCRDTWNNVINFGGMPSLPTKNPHIPNGLGVYQSE